MCFAASPPLPVVDEARRPDNAGERVVGSVYIADGDNSLDMVELALRLDAMKRNRAPLHHQETGGQRGDCNETGVQHIHCDGQSSKTFASPWLLASSSKAFTIASLRLKRAGIEPLSVSRSQIPRRTASRSSALIRSKNCRSIRFTTFLTSNWTLAVSVKHREQSI